MAIFYLILAGVFEIGWTIGMKYSQAFSKAWPSTLTVISSCLSLYFLTLSVKEIPLSTAYAMWTGIGIIGSCIFGIILFEESVSLLKFFFIGCIFIGIIGLKLIK